jgi:acyl-CoA hydrolase
VRKILDSTHAIPVLAATDRLFSVNGAIEVDLSGQVNAEVAAGR